MIGVSNTRGAILNWSSAVNGTASTAARWNPAQVPVAADSLVFDTTAGTQSYSVTFDGTTSGSTAMTFAQDNVSVSSTVTHTTSGNVIVGSVAGQTGVVTYTSGTWNAGGLRMGNVASSTGQLNVSGSAADVIVTGAGNSLIIGNSGSGALVVNNVGLVHCNNMMLCGSASGSLGALTVTGAPAVIGGGRSTLDINGTGTSFLGLQGNCNATISGGGLVSIAGDLSMGERSTSTATLTIGGSGGIAGLLDATLDVAGDFNMAVFAGGAGGGDATTTVNNGGSLNVGGLLMLGTGTNNGTAVLNINTGALVTVHTLSKGNFGTLNHTGGTLRINGGFNNAAGIPMSVSGSTGNGTTLIYQNGASELLGSSGGVSLIVGNDMGAGTFDGTMRVESGSTVNAQAGDINIGDDASTTGTIVVSGTGSQLVANQPSCNIRVGFNGVGTLTVDNNGQVLATDIQVPASSLNGDGTVLMNENGGVPTITTGTMSVGNAVGLGHGTVTINRGTLNITNAAIGAVVRDTGLLSVTGASVLNVTGTMLLDGGHLQVGGPVHVGALLDVDTDGVVAANVGSGQIVDGPVRVRSGGAIEVNSADLTIGKTSGTNVLVFDPGSSITVGSGRTLTMLNTTNDAVDANGVIDLQGGTIVCAVNDGIIMGGGTSDQLMGFGTVSSDIRLNNTGVCAPSGSGLIFTGRLLVNPLTTVTGTSVRIASTGNFRAISGSSASNRSLNCAFQADGGSTIAHSFGNTASLGNLTLGNGTITGVTLNGVMHLGTNSSVTLNDLNGVGLGTLTDMNGGTISCTNGLSVGSGRVLRGKGSIDTPNLGSNGFTVQNGGTIDPDDYFPATDEYRGIGTFSVNGRYTQQATGTYLCELAGFNNEFQPLNDRISCGPAVLAGTLNVSLIDGYEPLLCHEFTILNYTSRTGTWTNIVSPPGVGVGVRYEATRAVLFFNSLECNDIDFNNDGSVFDPQDIDAFLSVYSEGPCIPATATCDDIDFNNDCSVFDPADIDSFLSVFSEGPCHV